MGQGNSTQTSTQFNTSVVNEVAQNFVSTTLNSVSTVTTIGQSITLDTGDTTISGNCEVVLKNQVTNENQALVNTSATRDAKMSAEQQTKITNDIQKQIEQQNKALGLLPQNNTVKDSVSVSNNISNKIQQSFHSAVESKIGTFTNVGQTIVWKASSFLCTDEGKALISNEAVIKSLTESVINDVEKFVAEDKSVTDVLNKYKLSVKQSNVGIDPTAILGIIAGILLLLSIAPLIMGGSFLSIFKTMIIPLLMVGGYIGSIIFAINNLWIPCFICFGLTWVFFFMKILAPSPVQPAKPPLGNIPLVSSFSPEISLTNNSVPFGLPMPIST